MISSELQNKLYEDFKDNYDGIILIVRSNFGKEFVFFMKSKLFMTEYGAVGTGIQLIFYWINDNQLITVTRPNYVESIDEIESEK